MDADAVWSQIANAWNDAAYSKELDQLLSQARGWGERDELNAEIRGLKWDEVPEGLMHRGFASLGMLDRRAWPYFLPAMEKLRRQSGIWSAR